MAAVDGDIDADVPLRLSGPWPGARSWLASRDRDVGTGDILHASAHEREFDLILHVFDVEGAAGGLVAHQRADHIAGELLHHLAHARAGRFPSH